MNLEPNQFYFEITISSSGYTLAKRLEKILLKYFDKTESLEFFMQQCLINGGSRNFDSDRATANVNWNTTKSPPRFEIHITTKEQPKYWQQWILSWSRTEQKAKKFRSCLADIYNKLTQVYPGWENWYNAIEVNKALNSVWSERSGHPNGYILNKHQQELSIDMQRKKNWDIICRITWWGSSGGQKVIEERKPEQKVYVRPIQFVLEED